MPADGKLWLVAEVGLCLLSLLHGSVRNRRDDLVGERLGLDGNEHATLWRLMQP